MLKKHISLGLLIFQVLLVADVEEVVVTGSLINNLENDIEKNTISNTNLELNILMSKQDAYFNSSLINYNNTNIIINTKNNKIEKSLINNVLNVIDNTRNLINNNKHLNIILYLTELKKRFPKKKDTVLGPKNVNSGVTIHYYNFNLNSYTHYTLDT